jgi:LPS sulfotransferase NodH
MNNNDKIIESDDFPFTGMPVIRYLMCSTPRAGSTMLCRALASTNLAGRPEEYLRHGRIIEWVKRLGLTELSFQSYLAEIEKRRTSPNGVFGLKLHHRDYIRFFSSEATRQIGEAWIRQQKIIFIRRRNKLSQAISFFKAAESDIWSVEKNISNENVTPARNYDFSAVKISRYLSELIDEDQQWADFLGTLPNGFIEIWYEDMIEDLDGTVKKILGAMNIPINDLPLIDSRTKLQADETNLILMEKFRHYCGLD